MSTKFIGSYLHGLMCFLAVSLAVEFTGCRTVSSNSQTGILRPERSRQIRRIKEEAIRVMFLANQRYSDHRSTVAELKARMVAAYERDKRDPRLPRIYPELWNRLLDPQRDLLGGYLRHWESGGRLGKSSIRAAALKVDACFDDIIELESAEVRTIDDERSWGKTLHSNEQDLRAAIQQALEGPPWQLVVNESDGRFDSSYLIYPGAFEGVPFFGSRWQERCRFEARFSRISESPEIVAVKIMAHAEERPGDQWPWKPTRSFERAQEHFDKIIRRIQMEINASTLKERKQH